MVILIGYIIVCGSVFGGFALAGGHLAALFQPIELLMIGGAAMGAFIVSNTPKVIKATMKAIPPLFKGDKYSREFYTQLLGMLFRLTTKIRKEGLIGIEGDVDNPHDSAIFNEYPLVAHNHHLIEFLCDYLRLMISGTDDFFQLENLMDNDIDTHHHESEGSVNAINKLADGMPAFGIVAAVMGVVHTMESLGLPPSELGLLIAHALVGTFLGILLGYGFVGPLSSLMTQHVDASTKSFICVKVVLLATINLYPPSVAIEFGRKVLYSAERMSNAELEQMMSKLKSQPISGG